MTKIIYYRADDFASPNVLMFSTRDEMELAVQNRIAYLTKEHGFTLNHIWRNPNNETSGFVILIKDDHPDVTIDFGSQHLYFKDGENND